MNIFVPYPDIPLSLQTLDYKRLGKQRVEAFQCLCAMGDEWALHERYIRTGKTGPYKGWVNHPAKRMWENNIDALKYYYNSSIEEWISRGYNNTMRLAPHNEITFPCWWEDDRVHGSHRGRLMDKFPEHYSKFWNDPPIPESKGYYWPV